MPKVIEATMVKGEDGLDRWDMKLACGCPATARAAKLFRKRPPAHYHCRTHTPVANPDGRVEPGTPTLKLGATRKPTAGLKGGLG